MKLEQPKTEIEIVQQTLRVPKELNDYMQSLADKKGISKNSLILTKLWELKND